MYKLGAKSNQIWADAKGLRNNIQESTTPCTNEFHLPAW